MVLSDVRKKEIPFEIHRTVLRGNRGIPVSVGVQLLIGRVESGRCEQAAGSDSQSAHAVRESVGDGESAGPFCARKVCRTPICRVAGDVDAVAVGFVGIYVN